MKISQKGLYALQAMMMLGRHHHHHHQGAIKIREIAYEEDLPEEFLELILLELKNARMVERVGGASGFQLFWYVLLPASLPFIVPGLKQGWAFAWRSLITAEMLYLSLGLGQVLMMGRDLNDMSAVIAVMILIIAIGYVVDGIVFKGMERSLQNKWGLTPAT